MNEMPFSESCEACFEICLTQEDLNNVGRPDLRPADVIEWLQEVLEEDHFYEALQEAISWADEIDR